MLLGLENEELKKKWFTATIKRLAKHGAIEGDNVTLRLVPETHLPDDQLVIWMSPAFYSSVVKNETVTFPKYEPKEEDNE